MNTKTIDITTTLSSVVAIVFLIAIAYLFLYLNYCENNKNIIFTVCKDYSMIDYYKDCAVDFGYTIADLVKPGIKEEHEAKFIRETCDAIISNMDNLSKEIYTGTPEEQAAKLRAYGGTGYIPGYGKVQGG